MKTLNLTGVERLSAKAHGQGVVACTSDSEFELPLSSTASGFVFDIAAFGCTVTLKAIGLDLIAGHRTVKVTGYAHVLAGNGGYQILGEFTTGKDDESITEDS